MALHSGTSHWPEARLEFPSHRKIVDATGFFTFLEIVPDSHVSIDFQPRSPELVDKLGVGKRNRGQILFSIGRGESIASPQQNLTDAQAEYKQQGK